MIWLIWLVILTAALTMFFRSKYSRFKKAGVKHFTPVPPLGNQINVLTRRYHFTEMFERTYFAFPNSRFVGHFELLKPIIIARDIELIKKITVKDFEHFVDHRGFVDDTVDKFFGRNLFSLKGEEWKDMRSTLSPAFTSSKIRLMVPFMTEVGEQMISSLKGKIKDTGLGYADVECKDLATRYANDVIASCAFGLKVDSQSDPNNEFYRMGKSATNFGAEAFLKFIVYSWIPLLSKLLKLELFPEEVKNFFGNLVLDTMKNREAHNIIRNDMIHLLMEAKKGKLQHDDSSPHDTDAGFATVEESKVGKKTIVRAWAEVDLIAQAVLFLLAGFDTVATAMNFLMYELALNPDVQDRLYQEIINNERCNDYKFDYNSVQKMTYLDMVISEILRLWPPVILLDRKCVKLYNLGRANPQSTEDYTIQLNEGINIPVWAIHHDAQYYPEPLKFDPERFSEENKHKINPWTYMPFGVGPRNCIGSRFALCEVKVMAYQLLLHMKVEPCERSSLPPKLIPEQFNLRFQNGNWLRMKAREEKQ